MRYRLQEAKRKNIVASDGDIKPIEEDPPVPAGAYRALEIENHRLKQERKTWTAAKKSYQDEIINLQDHRSLIESVAATFQPPKLQRIKAEKSDFTGHTAVVDISDIHCGAKVLLEEMNGLNSYSVQICLDRLESFTSSVVYLLKQHSNAVLDELVVLLKGDLISGGMFLHEETGRTDEIQPVEQVSVVAEAITSILMTWRAELGIPVRVYCVPGNHGRTTRKNEPSQMVANSLDIAACRFVAAAFKHDPDITFHYPESGEAIFKIYDQTCLGVHGHNMGSGGGGGVYGPAYTMIRGGFKTRLSYEQRGIQINYMFISHYHTSLRPLPFLYANGSVIGPDPYSMHKLKAIPEPPQQSLFLFHRTRGLVDWREIQLGKLGSVT